MLIFQLGNTGVLDSGSIRKTSQINEFPIYINYYHWKNGILDGPEIHSCR